MFDRVKEPYYFTETNKNTNRDAMIKLASVVQIKDQKNDAQLLIEAKDLIKKISNEGVRNSILDTINSQSIIIISEILEL